MAEVRAGQRRLLQEPLSQIDDLLAARGPDAQAGALPTQPARRLAVLACMDSRMDLFAILALRRGEAHIIRNAGGLATDDALRSLALSQRLLGTREVAVVQHTRCGLASVTDDEVRDAIVADAGEAPPWQAGAFRDLDENLRATLETIRSCAYLPHRDAVRGFAYDVDTGELREVA